MTDRDDNQMDLTSIEADDELNDEQLDRCEDTRFSGPDALTASSCFNK